LGALKSALKLEEGNFPKFPQRDPYDEPPLWNTYGIQKLHILKVNLLYGVVVTDKE
jgi:hypothetical protein